jgi:hypothetical protein
VETSISKIAGKYHVTFKHGVQTFILENIGLTKKDCEWQRKMLDKCFTYFRKECEGNNNKQSESKLPIYDVSVSLPLFLRWVNKNAIYQGEQTDLWTFQNTGKYVKTDELYNVYLSEGNER